MGGFSGPGWDLSNAMQQQQPDPSQASPQIPVPGSPGLSPSPIQQLPVNMTNNPMAQQLNVGQAPGMFSQLGTGLTKNFLGSPIGQLLSGKAPQGGLGLGKAVAGMSPSQMQNQMGGMKQPQQQSVSDQFLQQQKQIFNLLQGLKTQMSSKGQATGGLGQMSQAAQDASQDTQ